MSKGPGRVERAIRALVEREQAKSPRYLPAISTDALCQAAFGDGPRTKAQRVSALRAMHRIAANEAGWTSHRGDRGKDAHLVHFRWQKPPEPPKPKEKPQKVHELIWGRSFRSGEWSRATITSRGGAQPDRITVEWNGRSWQCTEHRDRIYTMASGFDAPSFVHDHEQPRIEQERSAWREILATTGGAGASPEALAMLGLSRPFTQADVKHAFKTKSLKAHPDQGGDVDFFRALVHARDAALEDAGPDA